MLCHSNPATAQIPDTGKFRWTAECLFSANKQELYLYNRHSTVKEFRYRGQYLAGVAAEYRRSGKKTAPWLSPMMAFSTGWFKSRIFLYHNGYGPYIVNNRMQSVKSEDTFEFTSITFLPQIGLQARPFLRKRRLSRLALSFRTGYQLHWVQQLNSIRQNNDLEYHLNGGWIPYYSLRNTTTRPTFRERQFPRWYIQCGISNELRKGRLGYRLSYSWQQRAQRGLELSLTCRLR